MKLVEKHIVNALKEGGAFKSGSRDSVAGGEYWLYRTRIAVIDGTEMRLGLPERSGWRTVTTKSRINAIADAFGLPRVYQQDYAWTWSDGQPFTGYRTFIIKEA